MDISRKTATSSDVASIAEGQCFRMVRNVYMRCHDASRETEIQCVNLSSGMVVRLKPTCPVEPVRARLEVS